MLDVRKQLIRSWSFGRGKWPGAIFRQFFTKLNHGLENVSKIRSVPVFAEAKSSDVFRQLSYFVQSFDWISQFESNPWYCLRLSADSPPQKGYIFFWCRVPWCWLDVVRGMFGSWYGGVGWGGVGLITFLCTCIWLVLRSQNMLLRLQMLWTHASISFMVCWYLILFARFAHALGAALASGLCYGHKICCYACRCG